MSRPARIPSHVNPLHVRRILGRETWGVPVAFGPDGFRLSARLPDAPAIEVGSVIVTTSEPPDAEESGDFTDWTHASMCWANRVPTYAELMLLKEAVWPHGEAYQIHPAPSDHVNLNPHALHLWGRADGQRALPNFGEHGSI